MTEADTALHDPERDTRMLAALYGSAGIVVALVVLGIAGLDTSGIMSGALRSGIGVQGAVFALAAIGVNLNYGYTGLLNFGPVAFLAAGSYGMGITITNGGHFLVGILVGIIAAAALALLLGLPTLRLRGDFLAITTIAAGEVLRVAFRSDNFFSMAIILLLVVGSVGAMTYVLPRVVGRPLKWIVGLTTAVVVTLLSTVIWNAELWLGETGGPFGVPRPGEPDIVETFYNWNPY